MTGAPITARSPGRVNLIGDHTDYTGGLAFPIAIDRYTTVTGSPAERLSLASADADGRLDIALDADLDEVSPHWGRYVSAVAHEMAASRGLEGSITTTIPVGAGLSSSAALEVAVALALGFDGSEVELAQLTQRAEHRATGVPTGLMDQLTVAAARAGCAALIDCHTFEIEHVPVPEEVQIVVRYVTHRTLEGSGYADRVRECADAEAVIGPLRLAGPDRVAEIADPVIARRARHVISENRRVRDFAAALRSVDTAALGELLLDGHRSLREDFEISTPDMDAAVAEAAATPGVLGARMTGGGFGGCIVVLAEPDAPVAGWAVRPVAGAALT